MGEKAESVKWGERWLRDTAAGVAVSRGPGGAAWGGVGGQKGRSPKVGGQKGRGQD